MKKLRTALLLLVFCAGFVVYPAWHRVHCVTQAAHAAASSPSVPADDGHRGPANHDAGQCPVCQVSGAAAWLDLPDALPSRGPAVEETVARVAGLAPLPGRVVLPPARGPPCG